MAEMMVNLRVLIDLEPVLDEQREHGINIRRANETEGGEIAEWVREQVNPNWSVVCEVAVEQTPPTCFIAYLTDDGEKRKVNLSKSLVGFACYDVVKRGVFGPSAVCESHENTNVATALLLACMHSMAAEGYTEATIGWSGMTVGCSHETVKDEQLN